VEYRDHHDRDRLGEVGGEVEVLEGTWPGFLIDIEFRDARPIMIE
jgi:hypothetical protein